MSDKGPQHFLVGFIGGVLIGVLLMLSYGGIL